MDETAYGTSLFIEGDAVLLLTQTAVLRITEGKPAQKMDVPLGPGPALMGDSIVYWHDGAVRAVSKYGGEPTRLGALGRRPQRFVASEGRFAWLSRSSEGKFSLHTFQGDVPRELHETAHYVATVALLDDRIFFVERTAPSSWRVGGVGIDGGTVLFSDGHRGRTPSMLAAAHDGVYFYDGPTRSVRRLNTELNEESVVADNVICSPIAVSVRVICAQVGGIFEIAGKGLPPRFLTTEPAGPIASITADENRAVWVADSGENRLAIRSVSWSERSQ